MHHCPTNDSVPEVYTHLYQKVIEIDTLCTYLFLRHASMNPRWNADNILNDDSSHYVINTKILTNIHEHLNEGMVLPPAPKSFCINRKQRWNIKPESQYFETIKPHWILPHSANSNNTCFPSISNQIFGPAFSVNRQLPTTANPTDDNQFIHFESTGVEGLFRYRIDF